MDRTFTEDEFLNLAYKLNDLNKNFLKQWINKKCIITWRTMTPLNWAAYEGHLDIVKYLVENGADVKLSGNYIIQYAANNGHSDVVKYLLSTYIYSEENIYYYANFVRYTNDREIMRNYKKFSNTKACKY